MVETSFEHPQSKIIGVIQVRIRLYELRVEWWQVNFDIPQ